MGLRARPTFLMMTAFLEVLGAALNLAVIEEKDKYQDKFISLKKAYYEEENKPDSERNDAVLDNLSFELRLLGTTLVAEIGKQNAPNQS